MKTVKLNNGVEMPIIGFGTYQITETEECKNSVYEAIKAGYRMIDTAQCYGNEQAVGDGIVKALNDGIVKREELFITTKIWFKSYEQEAAKASVIESMRKLKLDYLDLCLIHWPFGNTYAAYRVMEEFYEEGKIKAIGVSNYTPDKLIDLISFNKVLPAVNQIETNLIAQQKEANKWLEKYNVQHEAYAPFGQGRANEMFDEPVLVEISKKYGKSPRQVALRYMIQKGIAVIPKSTKIKRIKENITIFDFEIDAIDMEKISGMDKDAPMIGTPQIPEKVEFAMTW